MSDDALAADFDVVECLNSFPLRFNPMLDLTPEGLLNGYANGRFPMADSDSGEVLWYEPEMRGIIELGKLRVSRSLRKAVEGGRFRVTIDADFPAVILNCSRAHGHTWISDEIRAAYSHLHALGLGHSVETWKDGVIVGGLYGVSINGAFFGESMFHHETDASKVALVHLVRHMEERGMELLDTQYLTPHLASLGGAEIPARLYIDRLGFALSSSATFSPETPHLSFSDGSSKI